MNVFQVKSGAVVEIESDISVDGWPTGERVSYTAVATDTYAHVNGEDSPRRKFVNVNPPVLGSKEIWLGDSGNAKEVPATEKKQEVER